MNDDNFWSKVKMLAVKFKVRLDVGFGWFRYLQYVIIPISTALLVNNDITNFWWFSVGSGILVFIIGVINIDVIHFFQSEQKYNTQNMNFYFQELNKRLDIIENKMIKDE